MQTGRHVEGIEALKQIAERSDQPGPFYDRLAHAYSELWESDSAAHYIDLALEQERTTRRLLLAAQVARDQNRLEEASRYLDEIDTRDPNNLAGMRLRTLISQVSTVDSDSTKISNIERALDLEGDSPGLLGDLYTLLTKSGRHSKADSIALRLLALSPDPETRSRVVGTMVKTLQIERALEEFNRGSTMYQERELWHFLGEIYADLVRDLRQTRKGTENQSSAPTLFYQALVDTTLAFSGQRLPSTILVQGVLIAAEIEGSTRSSQLVNTLFTRESIPNRTYLSLANALLEHNHIDLCLNILSGMRAQATLEPEWYETSGKAYFLTGNMEEAKKQLLLGNKLGGEDAEAWQLSARLQGIAGELPEAVQSFEKSIELDPFNPETISFYARFLAERGLHSRRGGELVRSILEGNENDHDLLESYARMAFLERELTRAESLLWVVTQERGLSPFGHLTFGKVYLERGDTVRAVSTWERGLALLRSGESPADQTLPEAAGRKERTESGLVESIQRWSRTE